MHLPDWMTQLLKEKAVRLDDRDFERDQAAIDAKLAPYRGRRYPHIPADPRVLDPDRLAALRDRLLNKYAYRWRQTEANDEIVDALFEPVVQFDGTRYALGTSIIHLNGEGESPGRDYLARKDEYKEYHYITVRSLRLGEFLTNYDDAVRLLHAVLPNWGFTARVLPSRVEVRLERDDVQLAWFTGGSLEILIVVGILDLLARSPHEVASWRSI